ncbi:Protein-associating with the carboxyl-terminal domain of ezrin [Podila minutissima]|nr:Protein-associating with the carboxyl-terminal domain of ezrin [Podila minutissima]
MGAAESKAQGANGSEGSSRDKLTFVQGAAPLLTTPVYTLRPAFFGKRPVSAFTYDPAQFALDNKQEFLPKAIKKLKTIRHPSVLKFIDCKTNSAGVHLITEPVVPLTLEYMEEITEDEILVGLYDILVALHFLHSQCHISHNNVQLGSIFVSNGRWVLGGMEFTGTVAESVATGLTSMLSKELVPPEHTGNASKRSNELDLPHAVDIWQYGKLVESLINDGLLHVKPNSISLDRMLSTHPKTRPPGDVILESEVFTRNNAVSVVRYCRLKGLDKVQNAEWNHSIMPKLHMLPRSIMEKFVLPQLLTQEFFAAEGFDKLYRTLFTPQPPQPLISEEIYRSHVMPFMIKLWSYRQADIRLTIFRLFEVYLKAVVLGEGGSEVLAQIILPEVLAGLQDADSKVYHASLCGLATAIPYALLVTTLVDADLTKLKFSVKSLYEQTLIPQIMAFWISEDATGDSKAQLVEVVMGMWCSIYTLGLQGHSAVKDISATLTLTLVSVLKLSPVPERVELITKSFTKHCTNGPFCISGLLKFLPQFLLDDDLQVREAAANAIASVAHQTITLVTPADPVEPSSDATSDANSETGISTSPSPALSSPSSAHISRIRQYCEKQQTLLPPRRPIFSRSAFASERSLSSLHSSHSGANGLADSRANSVLDLSSRRSSMVSQNSFMISDQGNNLKSPLTTPSLTRTASFTESASIKDGLSASHIGSKATVAKQESVLPNELAVHHQEQEKVSAREVKIQHTIKIHGPAPEEDDRTAELELMKALEAAKEEMRQRQQEIEKSQTQLAKVPAPKPDNIKPSAAFGWDSANGDDGDDWDTDDLATLNTPSKQSPSAQEPVEDEETRLRKEREQAEKQEQLRLKRDQKQQEMQVKREARRLQLAEKQSQRKTSSNALSKVASTSSHQSSTTVAPPAVSSKSGISLTQDGDDAWDVDEDIDISAFKPAPPAVEDELFKDLEVSYKAPAYVGAGGPVVGNGTGTAASTSFSGSTTSVSSSASSSSATLSSSLATIGTVKSVTSPKTTISTTTTITSTTTATTSSSSMILKTGSFSRGSSPASTPKRVASPQLSSRIQDKSASPTFQSASALLPKTTPVVPASAIAPSKIALSVDEALEEDGWGDDWE